METDIEEYFVNITKTAENDLNAIITFIAENNPKNAFGIFNKLKKKIESLHSFPNRGGYVPELLKRNIKEYRQLLETPWRIIYRVEKNIVTVLTVLDSRRNVQDVLLEMLMR